jgi:hypothetical protein
MRIMGNTTKCAAMAAIGLAAGLAVVAATPAQACFDWGYSGAYSYGWPYANTGFASYPAYSFRSCGGSYNIQGWGECNGYGPCAFAPLPPVVVTVPVTETVAAPPPERKAADRPLLTRAVAKARVVTQPIRE